MKNLAFGRRDTLGRLALWFYVTKRALVMAAILGAVLLAGFLVFAAVAKQWLIRLGA